MRYFGGILWMTAIMGAIVAAALADMRAAPNKPEQLPAPVAQASANVTQSTTHRMIGSRGCSASACHGRMQPDPRSLTMTGDFTRRDEYTFWSEHDPHARSLATLQNELSRQILGKLKIQDAERRIVDERGYNNCLACHATKTIDLASQQVSHEAVSCETCHGPAEAWRDTHYRRGWTPQVAAASGFIDTKHLPTRVAQCVDCHVGAADREVNHDLIAAGHPVLKFEAAAYHDLWPKHWNDERLRASQANYETKLHAIGDRAVRLQTLDLLALRAERQLAPARDKPSPVTPVWPEFAEFDCFACHHSLAPPTWYGSAAKSPTHLAAWQTWNFPLSASAEPATLTALRDKLTVDRRTVDVDLIAAIRAARNSIQEQPLATASLSFPASANWDQAVRVYLQQAADFRARQDRARQTNVPWRDEAKVQTELRAVRKLLAFEPNRNSPGKGNDKDSIAEKLQQIQQQLSGEKTP